MAAGDEGRAGTTAGGGAKPAGTDLSVGALFESVGKTLASLAGLAVFVYIIGGLTVVARLERLQLPAETIVPEIPRERLALLGLSQVLWTVVLGGLIAALALYLLPDRDERESWREWRARLPGEPKREWALGVALIAIVVLLAPWSANGLLYLAVLLLGVAWFVGWGRRAPRTLTLALILLLAGAVTVLRQLEYPTPFNNATVTIKAASAAQFAELAKPGANGAATTPAADGAVIEPVAADADAETDAAAAPAAPVEITGRVIERTDSDILLGYESPSQNDEERRTGERLPPKLLIIPHDAVDRVYYSLPNEPQSHSDSLAQKLIGVETLPLMCLIPTCEWDETGDEESNEPTASPPFVF